MSQNKFEKYKKRYNFGVNVFISFVIMGIISWFLISKEVGMFIGMTGVIIGILSDHFYNNNTEYIKYETQEELNFIKKIEEKLKNKDVKETTDSSSLNKNILMEFDEYALGISLYKERENSSFYSVKEMIMFNKKDQKVFDFTKSVRSTFKDQICSLFISYLYNKEDVTQEKEKIKTEPSLEEKFGESAKDPESLKDILKNEFDS